MVKFNLIIESKNKDGAIGDRTLKRKRKWPVLPRNGEDVVLDGNIHQIDGTAHDFAKTKLEVRVVVDDDEFDRLATLDGYKEIFPNRKP